MDEDTEELSFGKIGENKSDLKFSDKYVIFHQTFDFKKFIMNPGKILVGISYDKLCGYFEGACLGKTNHELSVYNGISTHTRDGCYPDVEFIKLDKGELEKLLIDTNLKDRRDEFENNIKTIR
jgi:hypothetical protein